MPAAEKAHQLEKTISILLADDHKIVRQGIKALLEAEADLQIVGETGDGLEAVRLVQKLKPDILVADISMPGMNGIDVIRHVRKGSPGTRAIVLSMHSAEVYVLQALEAGAMGYVLKETGPEQLVKAIHEAMNGNHYLSPPLTEKTLEVYRRRTGGESGGDTR